jgi:hypothetical protein
LGSVRDERQVEAAQHLLDQRFAELPLHEVVAGDDADVAILFG